MENTVKLAVLIDAENAAPGIVDDLLTEIANYGIASVKRIYGDWTAPNQKGWKEVLSPEPNCETRHKRRLYSQKTARTCTAR